ncbi:glycogen/starch/alpha-glucan phosphorylase [Roseiarcaceae bacterium H3SJ34-1]|uniref:glycogen/starch/alpha-glucan phosphorylase n=1 Tax=Terripilifer ovatus TaxID=3032367 RepID=UPI003AB96FE6|nr:glycogen/starch/alpha-glucan phosphorylase [Roseiarcaceae bacterium H3SJ34-1]
MEHDTVQGSSVAILSSRRKTSVQALRSEIISKLAYSIGKDAATARDHDWLTAAILVLRDRIVDGWMSSVREAKRSGRKRVYYLSLEFLIGRLFKDALGNLGMTEPMREALRDLGVDLDAIAGLEPDAALGNGGLGRLAACFMESMATVGVSGLGYGIRYDHGLFSQKIIDGRQVEVPEDWLSFRNPWEFLRREIVHEIGFGGSVGMNNGWDGTARHAWQPAEIVLAMGYDTPVVGWGGRMINTLRLWSAHAVDPIRLDAFNRGDHVGAMADSTRAESISRVLYPSDATPAGQELRLRQEYFFTSASLQDLIRRHMQRFGDIRSLHEKASIQLNDTHPSIAIAELMRLLIDVHGISWDEAWSMTREACCYTNHTLLPEALESWPVGLMERLLPRHLQIIYAINQHTLDEARKKMPVGRPEDAARISRISLIDESHGRRVRMGNLAYVGSHKVNGVSALHTELMKETVFKDLNQILPGRITNMTNGITPRRWFTHANPKLAGLVCDAIGPGVLDDLENITAFERYADDPATKERFAAVKRANKEALAEYTFEQLGIRIDPAAMFDIHVKRIHEYKRQLLNIVETVALYHAIRAEPDRKWTPRVKFFAGKAAASYVQAKSIIKLINDVAKVVNADPAIRGLLKVAFLPNYNVSLAEILVPAADLSEQISTAGMEASGTGNMKFALNGAITIGTLDGANVEMRERIGSDNIVIFGMTASEVEDRRNAGYNPRAVIEGDPALKEALVSIGTGQFSPDDPARYRNLVESLYDSDFFMVAADFASYVQAQRRVDALWSNPSDWWRKAILNTAHMGWFSSDRAIKQYAEEIWKVPFWRTT